LIVAGPNGSGKSSVYQDTDIEAGGRSVWIVNPDLLTVRIRDVEGMAIDDANRAAVTRIEAWLEASIDVHKSIGVETVLSTPKYRRLVSHAKAKGFLVWLIYVVLDSPERNVERVKLR
jgi:predicted ABC-type ATPase